VFATPPTVLDIFASSVPSWIIDTDSHFQSLELGPLFNLNVDAWMVFEKADNYCPGGFSLPRTTTDKTSGVGHRPLGVHWWIQHARKLNKPPPDNVLGDANTFLGKLVGWWSALQPTWKKPVRGNFMPRLEYSNDAGWGALAKAGKNGLFLVLLCILWLGIMVRDSVSLEWEALCVDFQRSLLAMKEEIVVKSKELEGEEDGDSSKTSDSVLRGTRRVTTHGTKRNMMSEENGTSKRLRSRM
jgi:hypothetical protein